MMARGLAAACLAEDEGFDDKALAMYKRALGEATSRYGALSAEFGRGGGGEENGGAAAERGGMGATIVRTRRRQCPVDETQLAILDIHVLNIAIKLMGRRGGGEKIRPRTGS